MDSRLGRFWVIVLASLVVCAFLMGAGVVNAANTPPLADAWNITSAGKAESSGELLFRVTSGPGHAPIEVTVFVLSGTNETGVASSIRRALDTQLDKSRFNVAAGEGANVLLTRDRGGQGFSVELVDSDVDNVRVSVQSATPVAPPTVPQQEAPANSPAIPSTPPAPGDALPPNESPPMGPAPATPSTPPAIPSAPPAGPSAPPTSPSAPPDAGAAPPAIPSAPPAQSSQTPDAPSAPPEQSSPANGGAGAPASAPPPPPGN